MRHLLDAARRALPRLALACAALMFAGAAAARTASLESAAHYADAAAVQTSLVSNTVQAQIDDAPSTISFYTDSSFARKARSTGEGRRLYVQVNALGCGDAMAQGWVKVDIYSERRGLVLSLITRETGVNSGRFRAVGSPILPAVLDDESTPGVDSDRLWAIAAACGADIRSSVLYDPHGIVFDSATNAPVAGARVSLIDVTGAGNGGHAQAAARVFDYDGMTPLPNVVTTDVDGAYSFPLVAPSRYRLEVLPPSGWRFPSQIAASKLPAERGVLADASYGGEFAVDASTGTVTADMPVDALPRSLMVQLAASRSTLEVGESVVYTANVKNAGDAALDSLRLNGRLPVGFAYLPGSLRIDGQPAADPQGGRGPVLGFALGKLEVGGTHTLTYRALAGAGALQGNGMHRVQARAEQPIVTLSNAASVRSQVQAGVFTDKAMVLGSVFADCNRNGVQDANEAGVPGVRLYLEDGTFVVTDANGRYSLYGLSPRTHVLKVDATTLPDGTTLEAFAQRHAGDGNSRFVDPRASELVRADFALDGCSAELPAKLAARATRLRGDRELELATQNELLPDENARALGDVRALPADGVVATRRNAAAGAPQPAAAASAAPIPPTEGAATAGTPADATVPAADLKLAALAEQLDNRLAFIGLEDGQVVNGTPLRLRLKGAAGGRLALELNGEAVPDSRVGERAVQEARAIELREYVGLPLRPGVNTLVATQIDPFGNERARTTLQLRAPGALARIALEVPPGPAAADGETAVQVTISLLDEAGLPVGGRHALTLSTSLGAWDVLDVDPTAPGVQTFVENGRATLGLRPANAAGDADLQVSAGTVVANARVAFVPMSRPMVAVGLLEGVVSLKHLSSSALQPASSGDAFARELRDFAEGNDRSGDSRAALFLKGKVRGDYLLTLAYDSDKDTRERLFRDIQPDAFYPIYGDASVKGYDAQSTGRLYVKIERNKSSLLIGDFSTQRNEPAQQLGAYQRSLTGVREHYEDGGLSVNVWASHAATRQVVVELPGNGTSGPFVLGTADAVENSEKVEILVRDRNQPSVILRSTPQQRFSDYEFEPFTGNLLLRAPLPSTDADLNPLSLRITFEVDQGGPAFWVAGADAQLRVHERLAIGGSAVRDWNPLSPFQLQSVNATAQLAPQTQLIAEAAQTKHEPELAPNGGLTPESGRAERLELQHSGEALKGRLYAGRSDTGFDNPSATLTAGRSEAGLKGSYALDERTQALVEGLHSSDLSNGSRRDGVLLGVERSFDGGLKAEGGVRHVSATQPTGPLAATADASGDTTTVRAKLSSVLPWLPLASAYVEGEQDVRDASKRLLALGGDYQLAGHGRLYARHEMISSLTGPYALDANQRRNTTLLGVDTETTANGRAFSEYRTRDALSGREAEAAIGLRNQWTLAEGLRANTSFERVRALAGSEEDANENAAVTGAIEYTADPLWKGTARLELRRGAGTSGVLSTLGLARRIDADWSLLGRNVYALTRQNDQPTHRQERLQLGVAYRDSQAHRTDALARYELKQEQGLAGGTAGLGTDRIAHIVSGHVDHRPSRSLTLSGVYAAKHVDETIDGLRTGSFAQMAGGRLTRNLGERWDVGVSAHVLGGPGFASRQTSYGAEAGYRVQQNLWASVGFNARGFRDKDLASDEYTERGVYLRLRFKFDENLFGMGKS